MTISTVNNAAQGERPQIDDNERVLPPLRQDLQLIEGGADGAGQSGRAGQWRIHDPMSQRFYEVGKEVVDLLALWSVGTVGQLREQARAQCGRDVSADQVLELIAFLHQNELLRAVPGESYQRIGRQQEARRKPLWERAMHGYLSFRVPLARPDRFLRATLPRVAFFFSPVFWCVLAGLAVLGLYLVSQQWETFLATFPDMFSVAGVATFAISLALVKTLHELGHGYTAARLGARVPSMGVAFLVMTPVLYTDSTDAWRLEHRRERVMIDAAGMAVEIIIAVFATLAWVFLPDGVLRHAAFALATTGWILSLVVNLNPLMRFDGYYLFSDMVGVPNLQERAFAMGRWWLRELLFGYGDPQPEPASVARRNAFVGFAFAVWIYRFFLFLGIALLVYHFFFKLLGIFMFAVELGWFIVMPIWRELKVWWARRSDAGGRSRYTVLAVIILLLVLFVPTPHTVRLPAVLTAAAQQPSFASRPARLDEILVHVGQQVQAGQVLLRLSAPELEQKLESARERASLLEERLGRAVADERDRSDALVLARQLRLEQDSIDGLLREKSRLVVKAPMDGVVRDLAPELHIGRWVDATTQLVLVVKPMQLEARGYVDSDDLLLLEPGQRGVFVDDEFLYPTQPVEVSRIAAAAAQTLDNWLLASTHGGPVAARVAERKIEPEHAEFEVVARVTGPFTSPPMTELRGEIQIKAKTRSLAVRMARQIGRVLVRESGA
jgi:putative peptide zinc metalloprotease protein